MNCTFEKPCAVCTKMFYTTKKRAPSRVYKLHLDPTPIGKRLYVALALHRALKIKVVDAKYLARFGGWTRETLLHADQLIELARRLDRLAGVPIAVVR